MRKVADGDLPLFVDVGKEGSAVVDAEIEDTVLIGSLESGAEDGGVLSVCDRGEVHAVEGRKHAELELNLIVRRWDKGSEVVVCVFGDFNLEVLGSR